MRILKFGGTSVGSAERMHALAKLIGNDEPKIVVLSAMSGTTNNLVEIATALYAKENNKAKSLIDALEIKYQEFIKQLY
jgi:aspartate kinase